MSAIAAIFTAWACFVPCVLPLPSDVLYVRLYLNVDEVRLHLGSERSVCCTIGSLSTCTRDAEVARQQLNVKLSCCE